MMRLLSRWVLPGVLLALPLGALAQDALPVSDKMTVAQGNNQFAVELYGQLKTEDGNLFFSPESISTALAMAYAGAKGDTAVEMAKTLHFALDADRLHIAMAGLLDNLNAQGKAHGYQLSVSNALWPQKGFVLQNAFKAVIEHHYHGGLNEVDYIGNSEAARVTINHWVEEHTAHKITNLIPQGAVDQMTRLVLTNAVYFKGSWLTPFEKSATTQESFYPGSQLSHVVPTMHRTGNFNYFDGGTFQALEIPYVKNDLSMIVFLPGEVTGLPALELKMTPAQVTDWLTQLRPRHDVQLSLPRFKLEAQFELAGTLATMGMPEAFSDAADFSGMTGQRELRISKVIHKAYADVNEEGTEAAAATGVVMKSLAVMRQPEPPVIFKADHPFVFIIRDNASGSILFMGRMNDIK
jgi:serpin B